MLKFKPQNYIGLVAPTFFILLTGGFLLYNEFIARGFLKPLPWGFNALTNAAALILLGVPALYLIFFSTAFHRSLYLKAVVTLALWLSAVALIYSLVGYKNSQHEAVSQTIKTLLLWFTMFSVGLFLRPSKILNKLVISFLVLVIVFIAVHYTSTASLTYIATRNEGHSLEFVASYQGYARSLSILFLYACALFYNHPVMQLSSVSIGCISLFFAGARSEFIAYLVVGLAVLSIDMLRLRLKQMSLKKSRFIAFSSFLILLILMITYIIMGEGSGSRMFELSDLANSTSNIARQRLHQLGLVHISTSPVFGVFGGHIVDGAVKSAYMHNVLSAWAGFGLPALALILYLQFAAVIGSFLLIKKSPSFTAVLSFEINLYSTLLLLVAKSVFWIVPPLGWGLFLQLLLGEANKKARRQGKQFYIAERQDV